MKATTEEYSVDYIKEDRDMLIAAISADNYEWVSKNLSFWEGGHINMSLGYYEAVAVMVDDLMFSDGEYLKSLQFGRIGRWDYFSKTVGECMDWYFMGVAHKKFITMALKHSEEQNEPCFAVTRKVTNKADEVIAVFDELAIAQTFCHEHTCYDNVYIFKQIGYKYISVIKPSFKAYVSAMLEGIDGDTLGQIIANIGMDEQMHSQLVRTTDSLKTLSLLQERLEQEKTRKS